MPFQRVEKFFDVLQPVEKGSEFRFLAKEDVRWYLD